MYVQQILLEPSSQPLGTHLDVLVGSFQLETCGSLCEIFFFFFD